MRGVAEIRRGRINGRSRRVLGLRLDGAFHPTMGKAAVRDPDGKIVWEDDWRLNALTDQGEESMLRVYFLEEATPEKHLALLNGAEPPETATVQTVNETQAPGANGYARQPLPAADWAAPVLVDGDHRTTAAQKVFGPAAIAWQVTHVALMTSATGNTSPETLLILTISLGGTATVSPSQSFLYQAAVTAR